jgi:hypothetical protein
VVAVSFNFNNAPPGAPLPLVFTINNAFQLQELMNGHGQMVFAAEPSFATSTGVPGVLTTDYVEALIRYRQ